MKQSEVLGEVETKDWVTYEKKDPGYAILQIKKEPVNAFDLNLWRALEAKIHELELDDK